ncbi:MAG: maltose acetyltransferase domain-containing protein [Bifidobacterium bifidum]
MLAGKLYNPADPELSAMRKRAGDLCTRFNALPRGCLCSMVLRPVERLVFSPKER